jgi:hypothetical protein
MPPQMLHLMVLVTMALSWHCHDLWLSAPQFEHLQ